MFVLAFSNISDSHRILGIFPLNAKSHNMMFEAVMVGLAKRGHRVDVIGHYPVKHAPKTYKTIINLNGTLVNLVNNFTITYAKELRDDLVSSAAVTYGNHLCELIKLKEMQAFIKNPPKDPPYDLVITEVSINCISYVMFQNATT